MATEHTRRRQIFGGKDLIEVWSSVAAQMHGYKLGVGAVILVDEEV